ncbi:WD40/YVTN repeat-like-containing domain superfamily [Sesbania bispinosa]|nr:WD40/YVTN repeat-like-containing domain superfamily [Sesbania bispinosa]
MVPEKTQLDVADQNHDMDVDIDLREVYFLIMHFLSAGPCHKSYLQFWNELLEHQLLPRRYHAWYSRSGACSGDVDDDGLSFPLSYNKLMERYPHIEKDHLVKLLKQLLLNKASPSLGMSTGNAPNAADVPTLLGRGSFSLLSYDRDKINEVKRPPPYMRWPHMKANQVHGLNLREIGGGFPRHHRAPSIRAACYAIAKPSTMVQKMQNIKRLRGHRNAVYCDILGNIKVPLTMELGRAVAHLQVLCHRAIRFFAVAFNANGTVFVTVSSDNLARVWNACKLSMDDNDQPNNEIDVLSGHENDVNYVQFSHISIFHNKTWKEENVPKFKNSCYLPSRDGSAIIWIPKSRRSHGKSGRWTRAYHLRVPPPPMPPQPQRGGPRQRILPTPRGVNMIVWSLDNRFVLAAIMDCRICVWNASDGSLVHSLTGHTESTYVLDVHPFNPRIAMSAGYDGRTIVWDIWEGMPIRIYEITFQVGGWKVFTVSQGESQKDAKYDQFFLGDYRPLIQDTHGNVIDQETQIVPYRRNMQDLLCDSAMIPYPEPYQSEFQQRRLGALGLEWRPSSLKLAVGPDFFSLDPDYHMLPLADLDVLTEPLPEFIDAMDWEPEIEVFSDDNDSEYNVTEDCSSRGEKGCSSSNASGDSGQHR